MEKVRNAIWNLNGVRIREKILKVSFAKYDNNGKHWNGPFLQKGEKVSEAVGREEKSMKALVNGRSFKEVLEGLPHHLKVDEWVSKNPRKMAGSDVEKNIWKVDKMFFKEMVGDWLKRFLAQPIWRR